MSELHHNLQRLHEELRGAERLEPDDRALLEITARRHPPAARESAGRARDRPAGRRQRMHGDALEGAAVRLEAGHPGVAGAIRAVLDALGKAGI